MSQDDYVNCLNSEVTQDQEAIDFILHILKLGGEDLLKKIYDWFNKQPDWFKAWLAWAATQFGKSDAAKKVLAAVFSEEAAVAILAVMAGLSLGVFLALLAGAVSCLPKLAQ